MYAFCWSCPSATFASQQGGFVPREWKAAKGLLSRLTLVMQENRDISHLRVLPRAIPNSFFIMFILDERLLIKEEHQHSIQI